MDILETCGLEKKGEDSVSNLDTKYLIHHIGTPLTKALSEIVQKQPLDPIEYLSCWLFKYKENQLVIKREKEHFKMLMEAEIEKMKKLACIEEEKRLTRKKRKELLELKRIEKMGIEEEERKKRELEEARDKSLQSPEKKDENGQTTLHHMASGYEADFSHLDKILFLLAERDADLRTPRDVAQQLGYESNVTEIDKHVLKLFRNGDTTLLKQLLLNNYDHFQEALDLKSDSEVFPEISNTFISKIGDTQEKITNVFLAIQDGDEEATEKLLDSQPQLATSKNNQGHTLLHIAVLFDNLSAVKIILEINPETTNIPDNVNRTPLHFAFALSEPLSEILLENKALDYVMDIMNKSPADYKADPSEILNIKDYYTNNLPKVEVEPAEPGTETETAPTNSENTHSPGEITVIPEETE